MQNKLYISLIVLFSCLLTATSGILLKKGMRTANATTAMFFSLTITWIVLGILTIFFALDTKFDQKGIVIYSAIGSFAPLVVRYFTYKGIDHIGASKSAPIRSLTPLFAYFFAVVFLGEALNPPVLIGTIFIVAGTLLLAEKKKNYMSNSDLKFTYFLFPLTAALLAGIATNLRKYGFEYMDSPILAAFLTANSAYFLFTIFLFTFRKVNLLMFNRNSILFFSLSSFCTAVTILLTLFSLQHSKVTLVSPLMASIPLFTLILSFFFLKKEETITKSITIGTIVMFLGIQLVIFFT